MKQHSAGSCEGYSLIELLVAIAILALVAAPFAGMLFTAQSAITLAGQQTTAANLCREQMENLKSLGFNAVSILYRDPLVENPVSGFPGYKRTTAAVPLRLAAASGGYEPDLLLITITVSWAARGTERKETLEGFLAER